MSKKYKVWLHLEEITLDETGSEVDYKSIDEEVLPLPIVETQFAEDAVAVMNEIYETYWKNCKSSMIMKHCGKEEMLIY